ncbi:unnamed protein product [Aureobasidium uvarum]|uniref:Uncharacterized protein n=1 Tax=Aureobasidium uvarum TaxID=2773716 RepID=A0A9N8PXR8_9PEZI|nr:unnamed protein product [Aureobasidium uvarum]
MVAFEAGELERAREVQAVLAEADWVAIKGGFVAVKVGLNEQYGYGGQPRSPCAMPEADVQSDMMAGLSRLFELEREFQKL